MAKKTPPVDDPFSSRDVESDETSQATASEEKKAPPVNDVIEDRKEFIEQAMEREKEGLPVGGYSIEVPKGSVPVVANKNFVVDRKIFDEGETIAAIRKGADLSNIQAKDVLECACSFSGFVRAIGANHVCLK